MTEEKCPHNFDGDLSNFNQKEPFFGFWDFLLTLIFLFSFFGCLYFYFENRTLKQEIEQKHLLIMDLAKLLERKNAK